MKKIELTPMELEMRDAGSIIDAENEFCDKVWYNRCHLAVKEEIKNGQVKIVKKWKKGYSTQNFITKEGWEVAKKVAKKIEKKYRKKDLGPYTNYDWGFVCGKLSAIRWVLGDDWDRLDT